MFICSECAEKALGREITDKDINDLISHLERSTLNLNIRVGEWFSHQSEKRNL